MSILKPLSWIDVVDSAGVYCERTDAYIKDAVAYCSTLVADYVIRQDEETLKYTVNYGGRVENEYSTLDEAKNWAEFTHYKDKMQPFVNDDSTARIENWFKKAKPEPTARDRLTQIGCHYEEVSEMMVACHGYEHMGSSVMNNCANGYKAVHEHIVDSMQPVDNLELLDALCDQIVTAIGVGYMMGFDIQGALNEVIRSNDSKFENGKPIFNEQGKIMKGRDYSEPDLTPFLGDRND